MKLPKLRMSQEAVLGFITIATIKLLAIWLIDIPYSHVIFNEVYLILILSSALKITTFKKTVTAAKETKEIDRKAKQVSDIKLRQ